MHLALWFFIVGSIGFVLGGIFFGRGKAAVEQELAQLKLKIAKKL